MLDKQHIRRSFGNASEHYDVMASLQRKVGETLFETFKCINKGYIVDIGCGTGFLTEKIMPVTDASVIGLDIALPMLLKTQQRLTGQNIGLLCADAEQLPFLNTSVHQIVSNLALQWCRDLVSLFSQMYQVLLPQGELVFSTFGYGALTELKAAWAEVDDYPHVNHFFHRDELYIALSEAGFKNIQIIKHVYINQYADPIALMKELKAIGAHNVDQQRNRQMTSKGQLQTLLAKYPQNIDRTINASFEILYVKAMRGKS